MTTITRVLCLIGGIGVFATGVVRVVQRNEWMLAILGALILGFTISGFFTRPRT